MRRVLVLLPLCALLAAGCDREAPPSAGDGEVPAARPLPGAAPIDSASTPSPSGSSAEPPAPEVAAAATALSDLLRPIVLAADEDAERLVDKLKRQRNSPLGVDKKILLQIGDDYHAANEKTLQALDALPAKGAEADALEAIKDTYEKLGDIVQVFKEALFEDTDQVILGREDDIRRYVRTGVAADLAAPFKKAGFQLAPFLKDRLLIPTP